MGFGWSKKESKEEKASGKLPILDGFDWIKKGDDLVNSGKHKEAIKCYDKAIECAKEKMLKLPMLRG